MCIQPYLLDLSIPPVCTEALLNPASATENACASQRDDPFPCSISPIKLMSGSRPALVDAPEGASG